MKSSLLLLLCGVALCAQQWQIAKPGYRYQFPRDHFSHPEYQTEWWYYTGNLHAANGHRYGFELVFFRQAQHLSPEAIAAEDAVWRPDQMYLAHLALSDIDGKHFYHSERLNRAGPGLAGATQHDSRYWNGNWQVRWTALPANRQELEAVCDEFSLRLTLDSAKPPVIQGQNGVSVKGAAPGQASHYISFSRLAASGQLREKSAPVAVTGTAPSVGVTGTAWMDHEFFTEPTASDLAGWDWFSIQLDNHEELMLYRLRSKSGAPDRFSSGSVVDAAGKARFLKADDFALEPGETWHSPHSGARYPVAWKISVPSLGLVLFETTGLKDQELWSAAAGATPSYWEGAVTYAGKLGTRAAHGVGYLEMTGYREAIQLSGMAPR